MTTFYILLLLLSIPIIVLLVLLAKERKWWLGIFIVIPVVLFLVFKLWMTINYLKSAPTETMPDKYTFIHSVEKQKKFIYIWAVEEGKEYPITIVIPWTEKASKEVEKAKRGVREGRRMVRDKQQDQHNNTPYDELKFYEFQAQKQYLKSN